jgi:hypothetical protein
VSKCVFKQAIAIVVLLVCSVVTVSAQADDDVPRFEVGPQFTLLSINRPTPLFNCCIIVTPDFDDSIWKAGVGGRMTYNFTKHIAADAAVNFFPESTVDLFVFRGRPEGKVYQGQFGIKAGQRFKKVGVFGKARPGFVGYTEVNQLVSSNPIPFNFNDFRVERETYFSMDVGGVVEFYPSRNTVLRVDVGDTMIRYGAFRTPGFFLSQPVLTRPPETRHNLQIVTGFGFRF